jgi:2-succinyl-6-hydroxy-2,4-cyclohexadiene-1-carboxylate synthase
MPDLRGHGSAGGARPVSFEACAQDIAALAPARFALCGYSLGGRVALHVALAVPGRVTRLVLVSTSAGLDDPEQRAQRRAADEALAAQLEGATIEQFVERWRAEPLFADDSAEIQALIAADQRRNTTLGLAAALRGLGAGVMAPLWGRLPALELPAIVLTGQRDSRYRRLGERLAATLPNASLRVVDGAGHRVHLEAPAAVAAAINGRCDTGAPSVRGQ